MSVSMTPSRISESLSLLMSIQQIDHEISRLRSEQQRLPGRTSEIEAVLKQLAESLKLEEERVGDMAKQLRKLESDLAFEEDQIKKTEAKLMAVKTNEEYRAALKETDERKEAIAKHEEEIILFMDEIEKVKQRLEESRKEHQKREKEHHLELTRLREELGKIPPKIEGAVKRREDLCRQVPDEILQQYQRILEDTEKGGKAIVEVIKGICNGCDMDVLPQLINLIIRAEKIYTCPSCHRILTYSGSRVNAKN
ncbi:MAG: hypothetical protein HY391_04360 [Deltaproteobacteria bacterium]|nr:hypothetical protein [Deltaproteobacteria bacterium]